jgi:HTH-type transcriptional regulator/antitoxin HigA
LETLAILVARYEEAEVPLEQPTALEAIQFRMDQMDLNQTGLAELIGFPKQRISDLLNGRRTPSLEMIRALHEKLGIPAYILIGKSKAASAS